MCAPVGPRCTQRVLRHFGTTRRNLYGNNPLTTPLNSATVSVALHFKTVSSLRFLRRRATRKFNLSGFTAYRGSGALSYSFFKHEHDWRAGMCTIFNLINVWSETSEMHGWSFFDVSIFYVPRHNFNEFKLKRRSALLLALYHSSLNILYYYYYYYYDTIQSSSKRQQRRFSVTRSQFTPKEYPHTFICV